jgi:hypothetical protein
LAFVGPIGSGLGPGRANVQQTRRSVNQSWVAAGWRLLEFSECKRNANSQQLRTAESMFLDIKGIDSAGRAAMGIRKAVVR